MSPRWAAALVALALLAASSSARAGACCVGATSADAGRLGPCEAFGAGVTIAAQTAPAAWDGRGAVVPKAKSPSLDQRLTGSLAFRFERRVQLGVTLPLAFQVHRVGDVVEAGGGPGDLSVSLGLEPFATHAPPGRGIPLPELTLMTTLPTGIPLGVVPGRTGARATGLGRVATGGALRLVHTAPTGTIAVEGSLLVPLPRPGDAAGTAPGMAWSASVMGSVFARRSVTFGFFGGVDGVGVGLARGAPTRGATVGPFGGASLVAKLRGTSRLSVGLRTALPIPGLGRSRPAAITFSVGLHEIRMGTLAQALRPRRG